MAEPYDIAKRKALIEKSQEKPAQWIIHDDSDEDEDTIGTRKSLRTAEHMLKERFFTNASDRKQFDKMKTDGTLR